MAKKIPTPRDAGAQNGPTVLPSSGALVSTVSGPSHSPDVTGADMSVHELALQKDAIERSAGAMPFNENKAGEHGLVSGHAPKEGAHAMSDNDTAGASTLSETIISLKLGEDTPQFGLNAKNDSLDRVRVDSSGRGGCVRPADRQERTLQRGDCSALDQRTTGPGGERRRPACGGGSLAGGHALEQLADLGLPAAVTHDGAKDPGLVVSSALEEADLDHFISALALHRHFERETDPPKG